MKTKYYFLAAIAGLTLASCSSDDFVGDLSPTTSQVTNETDAINFGFDLSNMTRADIGGKDAATLLGSHFYVTGTKGEEAETSPTPTLVFDNYLVRYAVNTAGTTESNTANWEYVGVVPETAPDANYAKIGSYSQQTIKYWDYSVPRYDFFGFSTGTHEAIIYDATHTTFPTAGQIGVTAMKYGTDLANSGIAYTFTLPNVNALEQAYITDIVKAEKGATSAASDYGKDVTLRFKNLGAKVRIALYETVPGYSVKDVKFYHVDGTNADLATTANKHDEAILISSDVHGIPTNGSIEVFFPHVGSNNSGEADYDKAAATVTSPSSDPAPAYETYRNFGALTNQLKGKESAEVKKVEADDGHGGTIVTYPAEDGTVFLGRDLPNATFAGDANKKFYQTMFPVNVSSPLTLRVDYTLVPIDGAHETITVYGAKATVPSEFTKWLPNYAYTYVFKISDNTNGWTSTDHMQDGLFPITFDAVVAERTDATGEQATITTVATPSITTYQQNHNPNKDGEWISTNEYAKATAKNIYVQVMDNSTTTPSLKTDLNGTTPEDKAKSLLYSIDVTHAATATEAQVMDALEKRTAAYDGDAATITGRNGITLTKQTIDNETQSIVNGVDDNPITVAKGTTALITITGAGALPAGTYAYVYDYTTVVSPATARGEIEEYQPITATGSYTKSYPYISTTTLAGVSAVTEADEAVDNAYIYFSKTKDGEADYSYSYISVAGKTKLPAGLLKVLKSSLSSTGASGTFETNTFYFDKYYSNDGKYAVKVIKVI